SADGAPAEHVARWDGTSWTPLGSGVDDTVQALAVFDDGSGPALFAGGNFTHAGGVAANGLARWDGSSWSAVGSGGGPMSVLALAVFDDGGGNGPALYVGGTFASAGGVTGSHVARWDGASFGDLAGGADNAVRCFQVFDDGLGGGPALYVGGVFTHVGAVAASHIARWDGTSWSALGSGTNKVVRTLTVFDDGSGPALCAGGAFL